MSVRIYGLWPIGVDRLLFENRITATAAASSLEEARDLVVTFANQRGFRDPQMWLDPDRTCCEELMDADAIPHGFVALHYTPDWGVFLAAPVEDWRAISQGAASGLGSHGEHTSQGRHPLRPSR